jgi:2-hydroxychromene-2-carboxylate isomerase
LDDDNGGITHVTSAGAGSSGPADQKLMGSARMEGRKTLELWFSYTSAYTYLPVMRVEELAAKAGIDVAWKPFSLRIINRELGLPRGPFCDNPPKLAYM